MRLDKYLCDCNIASRSELKKYIKARLVSVNDTIITDPGYHVTESDVVSFNGQIVDYNEYVYLIMNKPAGVVTAREDKYDKTVMDIITEKYKNLSPVGRLDKDTEGLILLTNDGKLNHNMLSPSKHVDKSYYIKLINSISDDDIRLLENGVDINDDKLTLPAKCERISEDEIILTIHEGRFHQVKRMAEAVHNKVSYLKRLSFGPLFLPDELKIGEYRLLNKAEYELIKEYK